eukprot:TRINITY_DN3841_c0_g1_i1.p1 TRINITY_DN3841_c0_g1~~TRINITY_DN3841_c0_g1_i1.p1  ORF type:complete len:215 (+),score=25.58 TRINITY_DN3841_c0_g1_i1:753-1397(+)
MPLFTILCRVSDRVFLVESVEPDNNLDVYRRKGKHLFHSFTANTESAGIVVDDPYYYLYLLDNDICYLTFCDKMYPKKLAYKYLEEIRDEFKLEYGNDCKQQKRLRPFAFQKFDQDFIQKTKKLYISTNSRNLNQVSADLKDISKLLQQNITDILDRGSKIERVAAMSENLVAGTKRFETTTKKLVWSQLLQSWAFIAFIVLFVLFVLLFLYWY